MIVDTCWFHGVVVQSVLPGPHPVLTMEDGSQQQLRVRADEDAEGQRLDVWLSGQPGAPSRSQFKLAVQQGRVLVDGEPARVSLRLRGGEEVVVVASPVRPRSEEDPEPEDIPLEVLHEDADIVVVNKPAGMVVHPAAGNWTGTLVNALLYRYRDTALPGDPGRAGIVHRLDKETSGVIVVARNVRAHEGLSAQFRDRSIRKRYRSIVRGRLAEAMDIDLPVGRHPKDRKRMTTTPRQGRTAFTHVEPVRALNGATLVDAYPRTGRTHQIRVHLAARGLPILADSVYGGRDNRLDAVLREASARIGRHALHAAELALRHPRTGVELRIEAPCPEDFLSALCGLERPPG